MRVKLLESAPDRKRSFGGTAVSTLIHALLIGGTVVATGYRVQEVIIPKPLQEDIVYVTPEREPTEVPPPAREQPPAIPTNVVPADPLVAPVANLSIVPDGLPETTATIGTTSVEEFATTPREFTPAGPAGPPAGEPFTEFMVERAVRPRDGNPVPRYPSMLASAGVQGTAWAQFVVDTTGRVEPASIRFIKSDHQLFDRAVREVLLRSRFVPAEVGQQRVRQLVEQAFSFALTR